MPTTAKVTLSVETLHRLLGELRLGEAHPLFTGGERYYSPRFAQETDAAFRRALAAAGLSGPRGIDPEFTDLLAAMQRAQVEYYGWLHDADGPYSVLTAVAGRTGVLAERVGDAVAVERIDAARALDAFLFRLPNTPAARGEALSVRLADLRAGGGDLLRRAATARPPEARRLDALLRAERRGGGKLYTARRDPRGRRTRAGGWVDVIDLVDGRWALYKAAGRGEPYVTAIPGSPRLIAKRLSQLQSGDH